MDSPGTFFITKCLEPRRPVIDAKVAAIVCSALCHYANAGKITLAAFSVMRDHWHALFGVGALSSFLRTMDSWISKNTLDVLARFGCSWQDGFHDTRIRSSKQFCFVLNYVENNPVNAGLAAAPHEWRWSSAWPVYGEAITRPWPWRFEQDGD